VFRLLAAPGTVLIIGLVRGGQVELAPGSSERLGLAFFFVSWHVSLSISSDSVV
jgi:hypothetical protein